MKYAYLLTILLLIISNLAAQQSPDTIILSKPKTFTLKKPDFYTINPQFVIKNFTISDGLPNLYITTLTIDKSGHLWFGTYGSGCGYFDGEHFFTFTQHDGIPSNYIQKVFEDSKRRIWIATYENGVAFYDKQKWSAFTSENGFPGKFVWDITEDKNGNIWFAVEKVGLCKYNGKTFTVINKNNGLCSNLIRSVFCDSKGRLWAGSDGWGISVIENNKIKSYNSNNGLSNNRAISIREWNNTIWIGTYGGGLCYFDNDSIYNVKNDNIYNLISSIEISKNNKLLISTSGGGLQIFDNKNCRQITKNNGLPSDILITSCEDKHGNIWVGSYGNGISKIIKSPFVLYNEHSNLKGCIAKSLLKFDQKLLISISGQGLLEYKSDSIFQYSDKQGLPSNYILSLQKVNNNEWWAATSGYGLIHFVNGKYFQYTHFEGLPSNYILSLYVDKEQRLWIGSYGYGFGYLKNDSLYWFNHTNTSYIHHFIEFNNSIYIATDNGIFQYCDKQIIQEKLLSQIGKNIKTILFDHKGQLWIGTNGNGLWVKKDDQFIPFIHDDAKTTENIESLLETSDGTIYVGLWNGLIKLTPQQNKTHFLNYNIKYYSSLNGFPGFNCLSNSIFNTDDQKIWIGTTQGIIRFRHENLSLNNQTPIVNLSAIDYRYNPINWEKAQKNGDVKFKSMLSKLPQHPIFKHYYNHLTFNLNLIYLHFPELCKVSYRLKGLEKNFSPFTKQTKITYSNIPPGDYCLEILTMNEDNIISSSPFQYHFTILKPWWNEWWFFILVAFFVLACFFVFYKIRVATLIKRQKHLEREIEKATFEIKTKNHELNQQNIEIKQQRDEIQSQRDEIESQRNLLKEQKDEIELTHNELTSSIRYAQQIQEAMLPTLDIFTELAIPFFILFKPRDIVSGDFYWIAKVENKLVATVADCTGHGVPGAFMSMLGIAFLKEIVQKEFITQPDLILKKLRKEVIRSLKQSKDSIHKDGMDISLITIDLNNYELQFAGANNPLYIVKKSENSSTSQQENSSAYQLIELKPDKMPIGFHEQMNPFTLQTIQLTKKDKLFLFSDGYADQFGGPKGKKFMYKQFKDLLTANADKNMLELHTILDQTIAEWMNKTEQVDDITIMGIEI